MLWSLNDIGFFPKFSLFDAEEKVWPVVFDSGDHRAEPSLREQVDLSVDADRGLPLAPYFRGRLCS
jgi:hypothetical protein